MNKMDILKFAKDMVHQASEANLVVIASNLPKHVAKSLNVPPSIVLRVLADRGLYMSEFLDMALRFIKRSTQEDNRNGMMRAFLAIESYVKENGPEPDDQIRDLLHDLMYRKPTMMSQTVGNLLEGIWIGHRGDDVLAPLSSIRNNPHLKKLKLTPDDMGFLFLVEVLRRDRVI